MKWITITSPDFISGEAIFIDKLFLQGLDLLHIRKPDVSLEAYKRLLLQIPKHGAGDAESDQTVASTQWILPSRASVIISATRGIVSAVVESPAMLDLTEAEQHYFDEGGEL